MGHLYPSAHILFFCRERGRILAYCHGRLRADWTVWAQRHIGGCPDCFSLALRTLDALEKLGAARPAADEPNVLEVAWTPVLAEAARLSPSARAWVLALAFLTASLGIFIFVWRRFLL